MGSEVIRLHFPDEEIRINGLVVCPRLDTRNHAHGYAELHYTFSGSVLFRLDFREEVVLHPGQWLLIGKDIFHEEIVQEDSVGCCVGIEWGEPAAMFAALRDARILTGESDARMRELFSCIREEQTQRKIGGRESVRCCLTLLLIQIARQCGVPEGRDFEREVGAEDKASARVDDIRRMDDYFNCVFNQSIEQFSQEDLARRLHVSTRQVQRIIQEQYHMTFLQKLNQTRLQYAAFLLQNSALSVDEISERCGFSSPYLRKNSGRNIISRPRNTVNRTGRRQPVRRTKRTGTEKKCPNRRFSNASEIGIMEEKRDGEPSPGKDSLP